MAYLEILNRASGRVKRMSGFLLSLLSPVWRARLCGEFRHGREGRLELEEDDGEAKGPHAVTEFAKRKRAAAAAIDGQGFMLLAPCLCMYGRGKRGGLGCDCVSCSACSSSAMIVGLCL